METEKNFHVNKNSIKITISGKIFEFEKSIKSLKSVKIFEIENEYKKFEIGENFWNRKKYLNQQK